MAERPNTTHEGDAASEAIADFSSRSKRGGKSHNRSQELRSRHRLEAEGSTSHPPHFFPERRSHHHHHSSHHSSHKRDRGRSHTPTQHHQKHHNRQRSRSPASPSTLHHESRARSPRPAHLDASVAPRRPYSPHSYSHRRHRSRSLESRYSSDSRRIEQRRSLLEEGPHQGEEESARGRYSSREGYRRRDSRSPRAPREYKSSGEGDSGQRHRRWEESDYGYSSRRGQPSSEEGQQRSGHRLPRSPIREPRHSSSRDNLGRPAVQDDLTHTASHSTSRERTQHPGYPDLENEAEMYPRGGGGYHSGYGYGPPSQSSYGRPGYSQPPYAPHAGSPPMHGYPSQQPPYPYHGGHHQQSHGPQYQPQPGMSYGASPNRQPYPPRDGPPRGGMRGGPSGRGGRGHFANMSWTPSEGTKGGHIVQPGEKPRGRDDTSQTTPLSKQPPPAGSPLDDDNPFRPPADLRADDEEAADSRRATSPPPARTPQAQSAREPEKDTGKSKISFSIKGRATQAATDRSAPTKTKADTSPLLDRKLPVLESPLAPTPPPVAAPVPKSRLYVGNTRVDAPPPRRPSPPLVRKEIVRKKRIKVKPQLSQEHAQSESVYFRKTGNESVVGSGTYGKVYKGVHVYTGRMVALKKIRMEGERDGFPVTAIREIKLLQSLNHVNIVALQEVMVERNDCFMVFEYLEHDLTGLINHPTFTLTPAHKKHLAKQFFESLEYLHHRGVLHRDIKAANILVSKTGDLKLADFGLARFYQKRQKQDYTNRVITIWYRSPELLLGETQYGPAVDIWSAACVLVEIFTRHAIFPGDGSEINQLDKIYSVLGTPSRSEWPGLVELQWYELLRPTSRQTSTFAEKYRERISPEAFELLQAMFQYDPSNRPSAADVLEHPYFSTEDPRPERPIELAQLEGDWHEFESKALRKEKEKAEREARRREREKEGEKRKAEGEAGAESKRVKTEASAPA